MFFMFGYSTSHNIMLHFVAKNKEPITEENSAMVSNNIICGQIFHFGSAKQLDNSSDLCKCSNRGQMIVQDGAKACLPTIIVNVCNTEGALIKGTAILDTAS